MATGVLHFWTWRLAHIFAAHVWIWAIRIGLYAYPLFRNDEDNISSPDHAQCLA